MRSGDVAVAADRLRLERALDALVDNGLRHGAGPVEVSGRRTLEAVVLAAQDGGTGLPAEFLPHAFDRFSRPDSARTRAAPASAWHWYGRWRGHGGTAHAVPGAGGRVEVVLPLDGRGGESAGTGAQERRLPVGRLLLPNERTRSARP